MCSPVTCRICAGCGQHIEQALAGVPAERRCAGHDDAKPVVPTGGLFSR